MVDAMVSVFLKKLFIAIQDESKYLSKHKENFEKLKYELLLMESFLKDAERLKRKNQTLRRIMTCLQELIYEAEDLLIDCQAMEIRTDGYAGLGNCFYPRKLSFRYQTGKRVTDIIEQIREIKHNISSYLGVPFLSKTSSLETHNHMMSRWSSPVYDHNQVVGLEDDTKKIKEWIFGASEGILAIGIVGMGGLGKTTVTQEVFNDKGIEERFERRIWVSITQTFTEEKIVRSILRSLGDACLGDDESELLAKIRQFLLGKRYLIVMDDVWSVDNTWWLRIHEGLPHGNGNCVIITTRNEKVAWKMGVRESRLHCPKYLNEYCSWLLFCKIAFAASGGECVHLELEDLGKEIVEKCKGLPLAIKAIGGLMLCKPPHYNEWKRMADHFCEELAENDNSVMASLQLSYDELPPYLKSCFLCFSVFPEDCVIDKEQLVYWWIGESFIPVRNHRLSTEVGEDCFSELMNRCLIEVVDKAYNGYIYTCKVHDMVHDLVKRIAEEDAFSIPCDIAKCCHLGIKNDMNARRLAGNQRLRALLTTNKSGEVNRIGSDLAKRFCRCRHLQVLDLSKSIFTESLSGLLSEIGSLRHLTFLSLSNTHPLIHLPSSISKLLKLQILDISYCQSLTVLPSCIVTFEKLVVLDARNCGSLDYLPRGLGKLSNLEILMGFKPALCSEGGCQIAELKCLLRLRKLELRLTHGDDIGHDEVDALVNLQQLQNFSVNCLGHHDNELASKIGELVPPPQLHELSFQFYPGKISPVWLNPTSLPMLRYLSVVSGDLERFSESFWGSGNIKWRTEGLKLEALSDLTAEWSMVNHVMPSLRIVNVSWCPELESFPIEDAGFRGGVWKKELQRNLAQC